MKFIRPLRAILVIILLATSLLSFGLESATLVSSQEQAGIIYDLVDLSIYDLVHDSELILMGNVLDQNSVGTIGESQAGVPDNLTKVPGIRTTIQVEKVLKGSYEGKTIDVITEDDLSGRIIIEGSAKLQKGERTILFLYREKIYDGQYAIMGMEQGKYQVDSNGLVKGKFISNATSIASFEANIKDILAKPKPETIPDLNVPKYGRDLTTDEVKAIEGNSTKDKP